MRAPKQFICAFCVIFGQQYAHASTSKNHHHAQVLAPEGSALKEANTDNEDQEVAVDEEELGQGEKWFFQQWKLEDERRAAARKNPSLLQPTQEEAELRDVLVELNGLLNDNDEHDDDSRRTEQSHKEAAIEADEGDWANLTADERILLTDQMQEMYEGMEGNLDAEEALRKVDPHLKVDPSGKAIDKASLLENERTEGQKAQQRHWENRKAWTRKSKKGLSRQWMEKLDWTDEKTWEHRTRPDKVLTSEEVHANRRWQLSILNRKMAEAEASDAPVGKKMAIDASRLVLLEDMMTRRLASGMPVDHEQWPEGKDIIAFFAKAQEDDEIHQATNSTQEFTDCDPRKISYAFSKGVALAMLANAPWCSRHHDGKNNPSQGGQRSPREPWGWDKTDCDFLGMLECAGYCAGMQGDHQCNYGEKPWNWYCSAPKANDMCVEKIMANVLSIFEMIVDIAALVATAGGSAAIKAGAKMAVIALKTAGKGFLKVIAKGAQRAMTKFMKQGMKKAAKMARCHLTGKMLGTATARFLGGETLFDPAIIGDAVLRGLDITGIYNIVSTFAADPCISHSDKVMAFNGLVAESQEVSAFEWGLYHFRYGGSCWHQSGWRTNGGYTSACRPYGYQCYQGKCGNTPSYVSQSKLPPGFGGPKIHGENLGGACCRANWGDGKNECVGKGPWWSHACS